MDNLRRYISYSAFMLHWGGQIDFLAGPGSRERDGVAMVQQLRKSITALVFFLAATLAWGQPSQGPLAIKPDAPARYVVGSGAPLWGISQSNTTSPCPSPNLCTINTN